MRIRLVLAVLLGLLFCSLARLEVTEQARPAEDASNDFSRPHSEHETSSAIVRKSLSVQPTGFPTTDLGLSAGNG
jgi:hypothetical protein